MSKIDDTLDDLKKAVRGQRGIESLVEQAKVQVSFTPKEFLNFVEKSVGDITDRIVRLFMQEVKEDIDISQTKINNHQTKLMSHLDALVQRGEQAAKHIESIQAIKSVRVDNLKDIKPPVVNTAAPIVKFPAIIAAEITKTVETLDLVAEETIFDRDSSGQIRFITQRFKDFSIETTFRRTPEGFIRSISQVVVK